jgi:hypothetical protein
MGVLDIINSAKDYYDEYKDLIDLGGSAGKAYLDYKDQKRRNELDERAYREYMLEKEAAGKEAQAAVDLNLTPMQITGIPTSKADVTSFQKVAQGGIIGLKNGGDPNAGITALRKKAPDVVKAMGFNKGGGPGIEALRKKAPDVVKRMGFEEGSPDTVMFGMDGGGDLSFPKIEGKSDEYAILSGLFNDVDGKVDEQTKMQYYKTLIPYVYKNGDISKTEYDAMIEEVIVNKAKGGIANLKNGGRPGYMFGEGPVMDETVKLMVGVKEDNDTDGTVNVDDAVLMAYSAGDPLMNVDKMSRKTLIKHLNQMELPETDASEFDDDNIRQILIDFAPDMYTGTKYAKGGRVKRAAGGVMDLGGMEKDYRFNGGFVPLGS